MMRRALLALLVSAAGPAGAVWGPTVGGQYFQPAEAGAQRLLGWEVGLAAFGPETQGFWNFAYGQAKDPDKAFTMTTIAARLNFRLWGGKSAFLYGGGGIARDQVRDGVHRTAWVECVQAGILVNPGGLVSSSSAPRNVQDGTSSSAGPGTAKTVNIGIEGGYRLGPKGFGGADARVFLLLAL
jgi:hypothetical protein